MPSDDPSPSKLPSPRIASILESMRAEVARTPARPEMERQLHHQTQRGNALEIVALLDMALADALKGRMIEDGHTLDQLFQGEGGMLGSFGGRIRLGYALGLFSEAVYRDLLTISKIRNEFAHKADASSFEQGRIRDLTGNLRTMEIFVEFLGREVFEQTYGVIFDEEGLGDYRQFDPRLKFESSVLILRTMILLHMKDAARPPPPRF